MLIFLTCLLCALYALWTWRLRSVRSPHDPPYYPGLYPIIGHTHILSGGPKETWTLLSDIANYSLKKGGVIRINLGLQIYYMVTDPEDALTAANSCLNKHFAYDWAKPWLGDGLVTVSGPKWKHHRRMIAPAFSLPILHGFLGVFNNESRRLVKNLSAKVGIGSFNILPHVSEMALKTICKTAFGIDSLDDGNFENKYMQAVDTMLELIVMKFYKRWLHSGFVCKLVGLKQKEDEIIRTLNSMSDVIIKEKRLAFKSNQSNIDDSTNLKGIKYKSLLDLLLELSENNVLSDKEIREEVDTFIVAGYDTSALVISYTLMNLGTFPDVQNTVYKEIQSVFGDSYRDVDKKDMSQLVYTEAVLKETLRLNAITPILLRYADKDVQLKNYKIQAGSNVGIFINGVNQHSVWGADANKFRPERWFTLTPEQNNAFGSFSLGKRVCMGQHFALISMKTTLANILRQYRITADSSELIFKVDFLLKPANGCNVVLERRN